MQVLIFTHRRVHYRCIANKKCLWSKEVTSVSTFVLESLHRDARFTSKCCTLVVIIKPKDIFKDMLFQTSICFCVPGTVLLI